MKIMCGNKFVNEIEDEDVGYVLDLENGCIWYEDNEGNIYRDKEEYLRENRDKKIQSLLGDK